VRSGNTWDIFCNVIDNFGDIGVCWRLARQLAAEHGLQVRLWVDDLTSLKNLCPEIDSRLATQHVRNVDVRHWSKPFPEVRPADVVIEAFACNPPDDYVSAMAASDPQPVWINLEYLSAEDWVRGCHGLASPHPRLPLVKYFFFPGFTEGTGGLLLERGLTEQRLAFQQEQSEIAAFWAELGLPVVGPNEIRVSLFAYENHAVSGLVDAWAKADQQVLCVVPEGRVLGEVSAYFDQEVACVGSIHRKGSLEVRIIPFMEQERYDKLLWACDCNFVRGEDSFVRAQWAGRPLIWHIYPQDDGAHWKKLDAFLELYCAGLNKDAVDDVRALWQAWNRGNGADGAWMNFWRHRTELQFHGGRWASQLTLNGDLASNLVQFCKN